MQQPIRAGNINISNTITTLGETVISNFDITKTVMVKDTLAQGLTHRRQTAINTVEMITVSHMLTAHTKRRHESSCRTERYRLTHTLATD